MIGLMDKERGIARLFYPLMVCERTMILKAPGNQGPASLASRRSPPRISRN
jgi:hypothetical protein